MENVNKFKVFTIVIICTFLFAIAAIYSNTKDVSEHATDDMKQSQTYVQKDKSGYQSSDNVVNTEIENLHKRIDEISTKVDRIKRNDSQASTELKCRIAGTLGNRGMEEMSANAAINDARVNNNDLVVLCSF